MKLSTHEDVSIESEKEIFDSYINELNKLYLSDKSKAVKIARRGLENLGISHETGGIRSLGIDREIASIVVICILIFLCGFLAPNIDAFALYMFGGVFFLAGLLIGLNVPVFGLIFLCSHGGVGLVLMLTSLLGIENNSLGIIDILQDPVFTDGNLPINLLIYIGVVGGLFLVAIVYTFLHNLSPKLREDKKHMIRILLMFWVAILLFALFPRVFPFLIK